MVALIDFMPPRGKASDVVRLVRGVKGTVQMRMELVIRFGFGADIPWVRRTEDGGLLAIAGQDMPYLSERRISYILTTANNWSRPIGDFRLTVDKGSPDALVSFCADNVTKTGPTTFTATAKDFVPERELDVLIVAPFKAE